MTNLEFIKLFSKISITKICRENNVRQNNLWAGKSKPENVKKVADGIVEDMLELLIKYVKDSNEAAK